ncbi:MAG: tetratricopeptide repeat protein [Candidatus Acidiferrales bacterium]
MSIVRITRPALAVFLCFSLLSLPRVAQPSTQPTAQRGTQQYPEDQAGFPQYPTAQRPQRSVQDVVAAAGTASLNFPPDRDDPVAMQCEQLAGQPLDTLRVGDGVAFEKVQVDQALPVCQQAAERQPVRPRYQYLYGRVLSASKRDAEAVAQYAAADRAGYGFASFGLAELYEEGAGVARNLGEAQRLYFRAGNAGIADAFAEGGELYFYDNPPNYVEAKSWFEHGAEGGSADGFDDLGWLYEEGYGVNKDVDKAFSLFNEAAKRGSAEGTYRVGVSYFWGLGVQKDRSAACQWFIRAASSGYPDAEQETGFCYYNGTGVAQDHGTAFQWFARAGQAGLVDARIIVADMLDRGDGWNQDSAAAVQWYQAAAQQGSPYAMTQLGAHLRLGRGVAWSEAQAMQWFAKAAQMGYVPAETSLAVGYENGLGQGSGQGRQDYQQAAYWFEKAANQDDGYAQLNLGVMYEKGWGVPQNLERAKQLYARAAGSSEPAVAKLGSEYFSDVPASAAPERTPQRSVASSSKASSDFWSVVIVGALAIGVVAALTSGGSSSNSGSSDYTAGSYTTGETSSAPISGNPPGWSGDTQINSTPHYTTPGRAWEIPMGNLGDPSITRDTPWPDSN